MISFDNLVETKKELDNTNQLFDRIQQTKSIYATIQAKNHSLMNTTNRLLGKYFREPKKAIIHHYGEKTTSQYYGGGYSLQLSKRGIGKTSGYRNQIEVYGGLIHRSAYHDSKGLIGDVIEQKEIYEKTLEHLSDEGKEILTAIKEIYDQAKIKDTEQVNLTQEIKLTTSEKNILGTNTLHLCISDRGEHIDIAFNKAKDGSSSYRNGDVFDVNSLSIDDAKDFIFCLFVENHYQEINIAIDKYIMARQDDLNTWNKFEEMFNEQLAKYVLLEKI